MRGRVTGVDFLLVVLFVLMFLVLSFILETEGVI